MQQNMIYFDDNFNKNAIMVMFDFDLWVDDFIHQIQVHKESADTLEQFQHTLRLMIQSYYCSLMSKEEFDTIMEDMYAVMS